MPNASVPITYQPVTAREATKGMARFRLPALRDSGHLIANIVTAGALGLVTLALLVSAVVTL